MLATPKVDARHPLLEREPDCKGRMLAGECGRRVHLRLLVRLAALALIGWRRGPLECPAPLSGEARPPIDAGGRPVPSVAIELAQALVADAEVVRGLVQDDSSDLAHEQGRMRCL